MDHMKKSLKMDQSTKDSLLKGKYIQGLSLCMI